MSLTDTTHSHDRRGEYCSNMSDESTPPCILIVEDDEATRRMLEFLLRGAGYQTEVWEHPMDLRSAIEATAPTLIILNLRPENQQQRLHLMAELRSTSTLRRLCVVIYSADVPALRANADAWRAQGYGIVQKPFALSTMLDVVRTQINACDE